MVAPVDDMLEQAVMGKDQDTDARINAAIDALAQRNDEARNNQAMQLLDESKQDNATMEVLTRPKDIWLLEDAERGTPITGDLKGDGTRLFTFRPLLGTTYCQRRLGMARDLGDDEHPGKYSYRDLQIAYAEVVFHCLRGCSWGVRETVEDPETGETLYEEDGVTPQTVPLPITKANVDRLDMDQLVDFINAMTRAMRGEVSGQPS